MATIYDDLRDIIGEDAFAKIESNAAYKARIQRAAEVTDFLDRGEIPPDNNSGNNNTNNNTGALTLEQLTSTLNNSFTSFETKFAPKVADIATKEAEKLLNAKAGEFLTNTLAQSTKWAHEISQIESQNQKLFGESVDLDKMNTWAKEHNLAITSPRQIWEAYTQEKRTELEIERRADEKAKAKISSNTVPGVSPAAATGVRAALRTFGKATDANGRTRAEVLNEKLAELNRAS